MPACFRCPEITEDIASLAYKYSSIAEDVNFLEALLRDSEAKGARCYGFAETDRIYSHWVTISAFEGAEARNRCSLIYEFSWIECHLWALIDNDLPLSDDDIVKRVQIRRGDTSQC